MLFPKSVGEEQLGDAEAPVIFVDAEHAPGVRVGAHLHVVLKVHASLRLAGTAGRVQPEGGGVPVCRLGLERRGRTATNACRPRFGRRPPASSPSTTTWRRDVQFAMADAGTLQQFGA